MLEAIPSAYHDDDDRRLLPLNVVTDLPLLIDRLLIEDDGVKAVGWVTRSSMSRLPPAPRLTTEALNAAHPGLNQRQASHDSHSSGSSHSSHQERQREQHLGETPGGPPSVVKPVAAAVSVLLFLFAGQAIALWLFTKGFLLTRTTLEGVSVCTTPAQSSWSLPKPALQGTLRSDDDFSEWERTLQSQAECTLPPTYSRTLLWIIDALRYDFISDTEMRDKGLNVSWTPNPHYHGVLDLPAQLDKDPNSFSFLSHFLADAPTTTLQRLKGLTTGSLPTFIDAGSNFGGAEITEDNWLFQLRAKSHAQQAKMGIAGDDTWLTVFPTVFDSAWRFPFDSFNVEDLDGVDRGVEEKLKPFLLAQDMSLADWRLLVAHTLGVDHVGHRLGASHPRMRSKLVEMNEFLKFIVEHLPDDALLILMGDHGMDEKGDHGGDGELEVGAALWMYAKRRQASKVTREAQDFIMQPSEDLIRSQQHFSMLPSPPFSPQGHRSIPQIDIVPTISMLLGLPIPFNNLGSVIPEAFESTEKLLRALRINAFQIHRYLDHYSRASSDLQPFQSDLKAAWQKALQAEARLAMSSRHEREQSELQTAQSYLYFNRLALVRARSVWAKFESVKMLLGLFLLTLNVYMIIQCKQAASNDDVEQLCSAIFSGSQLGFACGAFVGLIGKLVSVHVVPLPVFRVLGLFESVGAGAALGAQGSLIASLRDQGKRTSDWSLLGAILPLLHSLAFTSNSFTVYEDRVVLTLTVATLLYRGMQGYFGAPTARLKLRMPILALLSAAVVRLATTSRVCREEQAPHCSTTFYSGSESTLNSPWAILVAYLCALGMPTLLKRALNMSRSDAGIVPLFFTWMLRPALLAGAGYWFVDWLLTAGVLESHGSPSAHAAFETAKLALARFDFALICVIGLAFWIFSPLCLDLTQETVTEAAETVNAATAMPRTASQEGDKPTTRIIVLGFANSFGSSYLLLLSLLFALHFLVAQPLGQLTLSLVLIAIVACAELGDHERDVLLVQQSVLPGASAEASTAGEHSNTSALPISMLETSTLALLGFVAFFASGHQATFASIQWRTAFVGFRTVQYPFSPLLVALNSFGPLALLPSLALPLLVLWNLAPRPRGGPKAAREPEQRGGETESKSQRMPTVMHTLQASLSFLLYHMIITLATAIFAAYFRRHLMLFKIWTPRFMLGAASLQVTSVGLVLGIIAAGNIMSKVTVTFGSQF